MAYCPVCKFEYEEGVTRCPDCKADLLAGAAPAPRPISPNTLPVRLCTVPDANAAEIIRAVLAENGVPAVLQRHGPLTADLVRGTAGLTEDYAVIMVPTDRLQEALGILESLQSGVVEWPDGMEPEE